MASGEPFRVLRRLGPCDRQPLRSAMLRSGILADLPVSAAEEIGLVINPKTARVLGTGLPKPLLYGPGEVFN